MLKQLIVGVAMLVIMMAMPFQYALDQKNHANITQLYFYVNNAKEQAKSDGRFTDANIQQLRVNISQKFGVQPGEVVIDVTRTPKYRTTEFDERELISYKIAVPINKIIASPRFFNISDADNKGYYIIENTTTSEKVLR